MLKRCLRKFLVLSLLLAVTGGQWIVLQSAAWAGMIINNLRHDSLSTSLTQTFDGQHPCPLCKAIAHGRTSEKKSEAQTQPTRIEFPPAECLNWISKDDSFQFAIVPADEFADSAVRLPLLRPPC